MRYYDIEVAGTKRALKLCPINQDLCIAAFLILGDTELTVNCAALFWKELLNMISF